MATKELTPRRVKLERTLLGRAPSIVNPALAGAMVEIWKDAPQEQLSDGELYPERKDAQKVAGRYKSWLAHKHDTHVQTLTGADPEGGEGFIFTLVPVSS